MLLGGHVFAFVLVLIFTESVVEKGQRPKGQFGKNQI